MAGAIKILPHYTYEDYVQWEGKWELIDGIPYAMSPAPTPKHQLIANNLGSLFYIALKNCTLCKAYQAIDYKITEDIIIQPDISILCKEAKKNFIDFPPALVVEILSPSTALKDRHTKFYMYQEQQIKYCLLVSPDTEEIEIFELDGHKYVLKEMGKNFSYTFKFETDCTATISFGEIWK